jgi:hypothetical protein
MISRLFVLWRDHHDRTRHVIGELWREHDGFRFAYEGDISEARALGFGLLPQFPEARTKALPYASPYLFSTFLQRIPSPARPDYAKSLAEIGVIAGDDPLEILARSGGVLLTDSIELAEFRDDDDGLSAPLTFRLAGERFLPGASAKLKEGDCIELDRERQNEYDANATVVLRVDGTKIGYVPRYYARMLARVLDREEKVRGRAERRIRMPEEIRWVIRVWKDGQ